MGLKSSTITGWSCVVVIIGILLALAFLPSRFQKREYKVAGEGTLVALPPSVSMDRQFDVVVVEGKKAAVRKKATLRSLLPEKGSLMLNFWATWCPPCVQELPSLETLNRQLELASKSNAGSRLRLVTISADEKIADIAALYSTLDFTPSFIVLHDPNGEFATSLGTTKFPETYWINASGKVAYKWPGPQEWLSAEVLSRVRLLSSQPSE